MKILVTGASGNVGKHVVEELRKKGERVVAAGTNLPKLKKLFNEEVDAVYFDFTDEDSYDSALQNVDRVFLMRPPHLGKPEDLYPFIDAMKLRNIQLVSFLSLMGVETNTIPPHHKIEKYIEEAGIPFAHIRPSFFMQNLSGVHSVEIKEANEVFIPAGRSKTSFIDTEDIGLSVATVLHLPNKYKNTAHTITGPEALDYYQVADILSKVTGRKITYVKPGYLKYRRHYIQNRGLDKGYVNVTVALYFMTRMGKAQDITDDFFKLTGRDPHSFEEFSLVHKEYFM
ncbi:SDR family oxidoreductase [Planococcus sp. CP5-4]|uniref:SDR family oxidoreductase n=1 Tax=unclassified Planococcus (in: firmicutes) TaxID=2662419 RepID=UPI001C2115A3|nr:MULTISPECIES: SDR family oxidoreductase [unclassified Planococcus (in: firmicutes)]MBU9673772.1 SDR family oxidoreductase [Planococcus sp. CP5-4_YE]MBV0908900.1 SDR family oxidoreductase [Planococcus sp. CP5-4_UN]MBW6063949.1 SDR family oxidoreductase [Planococcus sp. CP5-4]